MSNLKDDTEPARSDLPEDILEGAGAIAEFLLGSSSPRHRRRVYYWAEKCRLPHFRMGSMLLARKSTLKTFIADQEKRTQLRAQ
jgi:hypothetical protein